VEPLQRRGGTVPGASGSALIVSSTTGRALAPTLQRGSWGGRSASPRAGCVVVGLMIKASGPECRRRRHSRGAERLVEVSINTLTYLQRGLHPRETPIEGRFPCGPGSPALFSGTLFRSGRWKWRSRETAPLSDQGQLRPVFGQGAQSIGISQGIANPNVSVW